MSHQSIYWGFNSEDTVRLKDYGAMTKGDKSVVKLELEVTDPSELADILRQCKVLCDLGKVKPKPKKQLALPDYSRGDQ